MRFPRTVKKKTWKVPYRRPCPVGGERERILVKWCVRVDEEEEEYDGHGVMKMMVMVVEEEEEEEEKEVADPRETNNTAYPCDSSSSFLSLFSFLKNK